MTIGVRETVSAKGASRNAHPNLDSGPFGGVGHGQLNSWISGFEPH
jgi:hypothetical protein